MINYKMNEGYAIEEVELFDYSFKNGIFTGNLYGHCDEIIGTFETDNTEEVIDMFYNCVID